MKKGGFDDFQVLLTIPNHGWSIERHDWVATSGTIKVIDKKGSGDNLTFTLMLNNASQRDRHTVRLPVRLLVPEW